MWHLSAPRSAVCARDSGPSALARRAAFCRRFPHLRGGLRNRRNHPFSHSVCRTGTPGALFRASEAERRSRLLRFPRVAGGEPFSANPDDEVLRLTLTTRAGSASPGRLPVYPMRNAASMAATAKAWKIGHRKIFGAPGEARPK